MTSTAVPHRNDSIELIRFIAAFSVFFVHIPVIGWGHWGVDMFFIISGLVMMLSTEKGGDQFFLKRIIRVAPTYYLFTFMVLGVAWLAPQVLNNTTVNFEHLVKSLLFIPFDKNGAGHYPILFLGWTLNFEIAFYLLFSVALMLSHKYRGLVVCFLVSILFAASSFVGSYPLFAYSNSVILEFTLGILLYGLIFQKEYRQSLLIGGLYLLPLVFGLAQITDRGYALGLPSALFCLIVVVVLRNKTIPRFFVYMGGASYALYLTHPYVIQVFTKITGWFSLSIFHATLATLLSIILSFAVAALVYSFLEKPLMIYLRQKLLRPRLLVKEALP